MMLPLLVTHSVFSDCCFLTNIHVNLLRDSFSVQYSHKVAVCGLSMLSAQPRMHVARQIPQLLSITLLGDPPESSVCG